MCWILAISKEWPLRARKTFGASQYVGCWNQKNKNWRTELSITCIKWNFNINKWVQYVCFIFFSHTSSMAPGMAMKVCFLSGCHFDPDRNIFPKCGIDCILHRRMIRGLFYMYTHILSMSKHRNLAFYSVIPEKKQWERKRKTEKTLPPQSNRPQPGHPCENWLAVPLGERAGIIIFLYNFLDFAYRRTWRSGLI